jgi:hypothetical protein
MSEIDPDVPGEFLLKEVMSPSQVDVISADFSRGVRQFMDAKQRDDAEHPLPKPVIPAINVRPSGFFLDACITDNNLPGWVVKKHSEAFQQSNASVHVGHCLFFNIPQHPLAGVSARWSTASSTQGSNASSEDPQPNATYLRTETDAKGHLTYLLSFTGALHDVRGPLPRGRPSTVFTNSPGWIANLDVTDCVREYAVRAHIAVRLEELFDFYSLEYAGEDGGSHERRPVRLYVSPEQSPVDWLTVENADPGAVDGSGGSSAASGAVAMGRGPRDRRRRRGGAEDGAEDIYALYQQMLSAYFTGLRRKHAHIVVYEPAQESAAQRWSPRFVSSELLRDDAGLVGLLRAGQLAQQRALGTAFAGGGPCKVQVTWDVASAPKVLYCVPLFGSRGDEEKAWWICFVQDDGGEDLWPSEELVVGDGSQSAGVIN